MNTCKILNKEFPVTGECRIVDDKGKPTGDTLPIIDMSHLADYWWRLIGLESRLQHPEHYINDEDIEAVKSELKKYLLNETTDELRDRYGEKYKICYDYIYGKEDF